MSHPAAPHPHCPERLELLTFHLGGIPMAADVEQVLEMLEVSDASSTTGSCSRFPMPKLLVLRGQGETRVVEIDRPGDIRTVPLDSIRPMPALVAACADARPYWGAVILDGSPVLLVDLDELAAPMGVLTASPRTLQNTEAAQDAASPPTAP